MKNIVVTTFFCLSICFTKVDQVSAQVELKKGDRIVFLGDSITQAGARPGGYISLFRQAVDDQFGDGMVEVVGAGISGHKVPDCQKRLDRDVIQKKPTHVVIYIGINDVWHSTNNRGTSKEDFESGLHDLVSRIQEANAQPILCTATVIGEKTDGSNSLDVMLEEYCDISRKVAREMKIPLIDLRKLFLEFLKVENKTNKPNKILTTDGVHLNATGNRFVSQCMMKPLGIALSKDPKRLLRHVVLFKFNSAAKKEEIAQVVKAFRALPQKIDAIYDLESGIDVSIENKSKGFTHGFLVTFRNEADRGIYLPHPDHQAFVKLVGPVVEDVIVFDYWTK
ncbi:Dabb family protein [Pirellulaceae bacterium]|nr:Dabb family protein [Pirellulaceae bacterium]